jgi:DNA-binding NarL/FixJ family response regulator
VRGNGAAIFTASARGASEHGADFRLAYSDAGAHGEGGAGMTLRVGTPAPPGAVVSLSPYAMPRVEPKVLVVDHHPLFAQSLAFALQLQGASSLWTHDGPLNALRLPKMISRDEVGVVVLGLPLADDGVGKPLIEACLAADARVLIITLSDDNEFEFGALLAGAEAVFNKVRPFDDLARDLFDVIVGEAANTQLQPRELDAPVTKEGPRTAPAQRPLESLTPREREVLRCLMDGKTVDEIAGGAALSVATVRSHVHAILTKLGVNCQLAAVAAAHRAGWTVDSRLGDAHRADLAW